MDKQTQQAKQSYTVLVALALDDTGDWALHEGQRLSEERDHVELHVVHVVDSHDAESSQGLSRLDKELERAPERIKTQLRRIWREAGDQTSEVVAHVRAGSAADAVIDTASEIGADLLIVGTHRRHGLDKLVLGSVAEKLLKKAHCPVLVALPKDYEARVARGSIEPPCPECIKIREQTHNETFWCETHARPRAKTHVYRASNVMGRASDYEPSQTIR